MSTRLLAPLLALLLALPAAAAPSAPDDEMGRFLSEKLADKSPEKGLLERIEDRAMEVDHSDRSKTVVEPWLSRQWFVRMADVDGGIVMGRGTAKEFRSPGLAQAALDASSGELPPLPGGKPGHSGSVISPSPHS